VAVQFDSNYPSVTVEAVFPSPVGTQDITSYVVSADTFHGRSRETDRYDSRATFRLDNWDGRFSPGYGSGAYASGGVNFVRPRVRINVRAVWGATTYYLHAGRATVWQDNWDAEGHDPTVTLSTVGLLADIAAWTGAPVAAVGGDEFSGARVSRILTAAGWTGATSIATGSVRLLATDLAGNGISQIEEVCDAEGGAFWIDPDGTAIFDDRASLVVNSRSNTSQVTFSDASVFFRDARPTSGTDTLYNSVTVSREDGALQSVSDATSIVAYGTLSYSRTDLPAVLDTDMRAVAEYNLARFKDPDSRIAALTIDPVQSPALMWPHALGRRVRDRAAISAQVARSSTTVTSDVFIESVTHQFSQNRWQTSFGFSNATPWNGFSRSVWDTGVWDTAKWYF
jgi:hypothetical protein